MVGTVGKRGPVKDRLGTAPGGGTVVAFDPAPELILPEATPTGETTVLLSVTADRAGTGYYVITLTSNAPTATQVIAGQNHLGAAGVTSGSKAFVIGENTFTEVTGMTISVPYWAHFAMTKSGSGTQSNVVTASFTTEEEADVIAPVLSLPNANDLSPTTASLSVSTNEAGTGWVVLTQSATVPTEAQIMAGQNHLSVAADHDDSKAFTTGVQTFTTVTGLSDLTTYYAYFFERDASLNGSNIATDSFTTEEEGLTPTLETPIADLDPSSDLGSSSTDNITGDTTPTFTVTFPSGLLEDDHIIVEDNDAEIDDHLVTALEATGIMSINLGLSAMTSGDHSLEFRHERGVEFSLWSDPLVLTIDASGPSMTSSATTDVDEDVQLAFALTASASATFAITGGDDDAQFEITGSTLTWALDGTQDYGDPLDLDNDNIYEVEVTPYATLSGATGTPQTISVEVNDVAVTLPYPVIEDSDVSTNGSGVVTLTSASAGDMVMVLVSGYALSFTPTCSSANLTYTLAGFGGFQGAVFWAITPAPLTNEVITTAGGTINQAMAMAISGVNYFDPFDNITFGAAPQAVVADEAKRLVIGVEAQNASATAGWTTVIAANYFSAVSKEAATGGSYTPGFSVTGSESMAIAIAPGVVVPYMTSAATTDVDEDVELAFTLVASETSTFAITGGADELQFDLTGSTLTWVGDGVQDYDAPADVGTDNIYEVEVTPTSSPGALAGVPQTISVEVLQVVPAGVPAVVSAAVNTYNTNTVTLPSASAGDVVLVLTSGYSLAFNPTFTSANLTFTQEAYTGFAGAVSWAVAAGTLTSEVITAGGGTIAANLMAIAISGADTSDPFDGAVQMANDATAEPITTTVANVLVIGTMANNATGTSGWTTAANGNYFAAVTQEAPSTGTYTPSYSATGAPNTTMAIKAP